MCVSTSLVKPIGLLKCNVMNQALGLHAAFQASKAHTLSSQDTSCLSSLTGSMTVRQQLILLTCVDVHEIKPHGFIQGC